MNNFILETNKLTREYLLGKNTIKALNAVDMQIQQGEFVAIMGPSGCGKSTLLSLLGGLDTPTSGTILLDGNNLADFNEEQLAKLRRKKLGFIFQRHDLFPVLTAQENIEFPMMLSGISEVNRKVAAHELLKLVGLYEKGDSLPDELSGGQQQRIGIARALANHPLILLADEPTGNLDSSTAKEIVAVLADLTKNENLTLIMVTHDPETAKFAERIICLSDGNLVNEEKGVRK